MSLHPPKTIFEPFRIKMVEPIPILSKEQRQNALKQASFNLFSLPAESVTFDFLTDSGTSAMSSNQWAGMMVGDESYAGSKSFQRFSKVISDLTQMEHIIPTHQGRSAEALLCKAILKPGQIVLGNTHFDTTRANIESNGGEAIDLPCSEVAETQKDFPFKGNVDLFRLQNFLKEKSHRVGFFIMTVTNNSVGGQPVSLANIRATQELLSVYKIPFFIDAARFAENSYFIKQREVGFSDLSIESIAREIFRTADGVLMSAKKDAFANIGGFLSLRDFSLAQQIRQDMVITEGFPTYGGLSGRDLEAIAIGLREILEEDYLRYRIASTDYFSRGLEACGFKVVKPTGGHAVYIDAARTLPHFQQKYFPAQALAVALYEEIGLRGVEVGSVMFGRQDSQSGREIPADRELVRLAIPRRVYTQSHIDYIIEAAAEMASQFESLPGYSILEQPKFLRHFTAKLARCARD